MKKIMTVTMFLLFALPVTLFSQAPKAIFEDKCSKCHSVSRPLSATKDKDNWTLTVRRMQGKLPGWINDSEADIIIDYLTKTRGK